MVLDAVPAHVHEFRNVLHAFLRRTSHIWLGTRTAHHRTPMQHVCNLHSYTTKHTPLISFLWGNSTTSRASYVFTGRYIGYLAGSRSRISFHMLWILLAATVKHSNITVVGGPLYDRISREGFILGTIVIIGGAMFIPFPFFHNVCTNTHTKSHRGRTQTHSLRDFSQIWVLSVLSAVQGTYFGASDAGNSVCFLRLHGAKANPWLQAMHFTYAIGTTVCFQYSTYSPFSKRSYSVCCFFRLDLSSSVHSFASHQNHTQQHLSSLVCRIHTNDNLYMHTQRESTKHTNTFILSSRSFDSLGSLALLVPSI